MAQKSLKRFEPSRYSQEELQFLLANVGQPTKVAMKQPLPQNVNPRAVVPVLDAVVELEQLHAAHGDDWAGLDVLKDSIKLYLENIQSWENDKRLYNAPYPPAMYDWDSKGRPHKGAPGTDAGIVTTVFGEDGERIKVTVDLIPQGGGFKPAWFKKRTPIVYSELRMDDTKGLVICPVCDYTINYPPGEHGRLNMAKAQMAKHLTKARTQVEEHRQLYGTLFGAPTQLAD